MRLLIASDNQGDNVIVGVCVSVVLSVSRVIQEVAHGMNFNAGLGRGAITGL